MAKALASADPQTLHNSEAEQMRLAVALTSGDQETVNEIHGRAWYVDVCRAEQRLKEFVTACKALLDRLPAGCQSETAAALHDLVEQTDVVLRPGFFSEAQREVAFSKYGSKSVVPASADLNSQEVPRGPAP